MKKLTVILIALFVVVGVNAQTLTYVTVSDTPLWESDEGVLYNNNIHKILPKGTEIELEFYWPIYIGGVPVFDKIEKDGLIFSAKKVFANSVVENAEGESFEVELSNIIPVNTPDLFDTEILTEVHQPSRYLIQSYFVPVLQSGARNTLKHYEAEWIEKEGGDEGYEGSYWWTSVEAINYSVITQSLISLSLLDGFFVQKIEIIPTGYKVHAFSARKEIMQVLYLQIDGDYVDVYKDSLENKIGSYVYVSPDFYEGVKTVIKEDKPVDLSTMIWPRRADGSSDYDGKTLTRQEIPQRITDPLDDTYLGIDEKTTLKQLEEVKKELGEQGFKKVLNNPLSRAIVSALRNKLNIDMIAYLIDSGADVSTYDYAVDVVEEAVIAADIDILQLVIDSGANVTISSLTSNISNKYSLDENCAAILGILLNEGVALELGMYEYNGYDDSNPTRYNALPEFASRNLAKHNTASAYDRIEALLAMGWQEGVDKIIWQEMGSVYKTTDNLRLRSSEGTSGEALLTLVKNSAVKITSIGNIEKIDGLIAFWLQVEVAENTTDTAGKKVARGTTGWLFGGYVSMEKEEL